MAEREVKIVITGEDRSKKALKAGEKSWKKFGQNITGFIGGAAKALAKLGAAAALGIGAISVTSVKTAIEVESAFAGVIKTTDGLVDQFGILNAVGEDLRGEFRQLAMEIPTDLPELMRLGEVGGQLGIARENLIDFTRVMAAMGVSTNLTGEVAATALAKIANVMGTAQTDFDRMASSVVALGNTTNTTEADIVNFSQRIAGAGKIAGLTEADVFGMAAAFSTVGIEAEAGGTAVQKVLIAMTRAVASGGEQLDIFAETSGLSSEQFAAAFRDDAAGAFSEFVVGLGKQGEDAFQTLENLELQDQRLIRAFISLSGASDKLTGAIALSNEAWDENTALAKEAEARYRTFREQLKLAKNVLNDIGLSIGEALLPYLREMLVAVAPIIKEFAERLPELLETKVIPAIQDVIGVIAEIVEAIREGDFAKLAEILGGHLRTMYSKAIAWVERNIGPLVDAAAAFLKVWVADWVTWLSDNIGPFAKDLGEQIRDWIGAAVTWVKDNWGPITEKIGETLTAWAAIAVEWFKDNVVPAVKELGTKIRDWIAGAVAWVKDNWDLIREKAIVLWKVFVIKATRWFNETVVPAVKELGEKVRDWIAGAIDWTGTKAQELGDQLGAVLEGVSVSAIEGFEDTVVEPAAVELGEAFSQIVTDAIANAEAQMPEASVTFGEKIRGMIRGSGEFLIENLPDMAANLGTIIGKILRTAIGLFAGSGTFTQMRDEMFYNIWKGIITGSAEDEALITSGFNALVDAVKGMWTAFIVAVTGDPDFKTTLVGWWEGLLDDALAFVVENLVPWSDLGWELVRGFLKGIEDAWEQDIKPKISELIAGLPQIVKDILGISSPSRVFAELGIDMMKGLAEGIDEEAAQVIKKLSKAIGRIVNAFSQLVELQEGFGLSGGQLPDIGPFLDQFELTIRTLFWRIEGLIEEFGEKRIKDVRKSAKRLREIIQAVMFDMSGIALADLPDMGKWRDQIIDLTRAVMQALGHLAFEFGEEGLEAAAIWAASVRDILGLVKPAVDALAAMTELKIVTNMALVAAIFADQLLSLVQEFVRVKDGYTITFAEDAKTWWDNVKTIIGVIKPGVDALIAMQDLVIITNMALVAGIFAENLLALVKEFERVKSRYKIVFAEDAKEWWSNVKEIIGIIKPGVDALIAMQDLVIITNMALVAGIFAENLLALVNEFEGVKNKYKTQFAEDAKEWWANAKAIIDIVAPGVKALIDMQELQIVTNMALVARIFGENLLSLVNEFENIKGDYKIKFAEDAKEWWAAVKEVLSVVEPGIKALKGMLEWEEALSLPVATEEFARALFDVVEKLAEVAGEYKVTFTEEALKFFDAVKKAISIIAPGVKALEKLGEFVAVKELLTQMDVFKGQMKLVIDKMIELAGNYETEGLAAVQTFSTAVEEIFKGVKVALEALKKMLALPEAGELGIAGAVAFFGTVMANTVKELGIIAAAMETDGLDKARKFHDVAVQIRTAVLAGINAIMVLGEAGVPALELVSGGLGSMLDAIIAAVRSRITSFFDIGFAMGRTMAQGIISGLQSGLANLANSAPSTGIFPAANGFSGVVTSPTLFLAGERGPESVNITPGGGAQGGIHIENLNVNGTGNAGTDVQNVVRMLEFGTVSP